MSTESSKVNSEYYSSPRKMYDKDQIARFKWDKEKGLSLKRLRGKVSRRELAEKLKTEGHNYSHQYIQKLEDGVSGTIGIDLLDAISEILDIDSELIIPAIQIQLPK